MICISTHGQGNIENLLFGSTTEKVLRKAECPVLTVRTKDSKEYSGENIVTGNLIQ
jgi:nucleotide-binding universal stress UspA family protein